MGYLIPRMMRYNVRSTSSGQALLEMMIALAIVVLVIFGFIVAIFAGLSNSSFSRNKSLSIHYAQEALELARIQRDEDFNGLQTGCCGDTSGGFIVVNGQETLFRRSVVVTGSSEKEVAVEISWNESNRVVTTELKTILTEWRNQEFE